MNLYDKIHKDGTLLTLKYYGLSDIVTGWDVRAVLDNADVIIAHYSELDYSRGYTLDTYIDFFLLKKIVSMKETVEALQQEADKQKLGEVLKRLEPIQASLSVGNAIKYINSSIDTIFQNQTEIHDIVDVTIDCCIAYQSGIKPDVFCYLITSQSYLIYHHYADFQPTLEKDVELFRLLFSSAIVRDSFDTSYEEIMGIISNIKVRRQDDLFPLLDDAVSCIIAHGEKAVQSINVERFPEYERTVRETFEFLKRIGHVKASEFEAHMQKCDELLHEYMVQRGKKREYRIPADEILEQLRSDDIPWNLKFLSMTHSPDHEAQEVVAILDHAPESNSPLLDMVSTNISTNEYFTHSHQQRLRIALQVGTVATHLLMHEADLFEQSGTWMLNYWWVIKEHIRYTDKDIDDDIELLYQMLQNLFNLKEDIEPEVVQSLAYAPAMFSCALSEKLMRTVYKYLKQDEVYVPLETATMGKLLSDGNELFQEIFGKHHVRSLRYFYCVDNENHVGNNYRNRLAHWFELRCNYLTKWLVCETVYLLIDVLSTFYYYCSSKREGGDDSNQTEGIVE